MAVEKMSGQEALAWLRGIERWVRESVPNCSIQVLIPTLPGEDWEEIDLGDEVLDDGIRIKRIHTIVVSAKTSSLSCWAKIRRIYFRDRFECSARGVEEFVTEAAGQAGTPSDPHYCKVCGIGPVPDHPGNLRMLRGHEEHCEERREFIELLGTGERRLAKAIIDVASARCGQRTYLLTGNPSFVVKKAGVPEEVIERVSRQLGGMTRKGIETKYAPMIRRLDTSPIFARPDYSGYGTGARYAHPMHTESD